MEEAESRTVSCGRIGSGKLVGGKSEGSGRLKGSHSWEDMSHSLETLSSLEDALILLTTVYFKQGVLLMFIIQYLGGEGKKVTSSLALARAVQ